MNKVRRPIPEPVTVDHGQFKATVAPVELAPGSSLLSPKVVKCSPLPINASQVQVKEYMHFIEAVTDEQKWMLSRLGYDQ